VNGTGIKIEECWYIRSEDADEVRMVPSLSLCEDSVMLLYSILVLLVASVLLDIVYSDLRFCLHMIT
jgi:hypothetical protein